MAHWGYDKHNGPSTWGDTWPVAANGTRQSPIDIKPADAKFDKTLHDKPLTMTYEPNMAAELSNNGHTVKISALSQGSSLRGGPLEGEYKLAQFHFHWGASDDKGSEHRVDGKAFSAELHLVHYNTKYTAKEAESKPDGLCALGIFIKPGKEHPRLKALTDQMDKVKYSGASVDVEGGFDPACLLPEKKDYWTYLGSLTTPPCHESITWVVFREPIEVSQDQLMKLRSLSSCTEASEGGDFCICMVDNFRPPMPIKERTVRASFERSDATGDKPSSVESSAGPFENRFSFNVNRCKTQ